MNGAIKVRTLNKLNLPEWASLLLMVTFEITNVVDHLPRSDVVIDVKICATVDGAGDWIGRRN